MMHAHTGNMLREAHGKPMRHFEWVAPASVKADQVPLLIEAAIPGLQLHSGGADTAVNGYVTTSRRPDGSLYICVCLYDSECRDAACGCGHGAVALVAAPVLTGAHHKAMVDAVGEHPVHKLQGTPKDLEVLEALGFQAGDAPLRVRGPR